MDKETTLENRRKYNRKYHAKYALTFNGLLIRRYASMTYRVKGSSKRTARTKMHYDGLDLVPYVEFKEWTLKDGKYKVLYEAWVASGMERKMSPSIDRIDSSKGYVLGNIQWLTVSDNSKKVIFDTNFDFEQKRRRSKYRGVYWVHLSKRGILGKPPRPYRASISRGGKVLQLGSFETEELAAREYDKYALKIYGRKVNFPNEPTQTDPTPNKDWAEEAAFNQDKGFYSDF